MVLTRNVSLGRTLRAARVLSGKTVKELAAQVGVSPRTYWRLEAGVRIPNALELERIAEATGRPVEFFLGASSPQDGAEERVLPPPLPEVNDEEAA